MVRAEREIKWRKDRVGWDGNPTMGFDAIKSSASPTVKGWCEEGEQRSVATGSATPQLCSSPSALQRCCALTDALSCCSSASVPSSLEVQDTHE